MLKSIVIAYKSAAMNNDVIFSLVSLVMKHAISNRLRLPQPHQNAKPGTVNRNIDNTAKI